MAHGHPPTPQNGPRGRVVVSPLDIGKNSTSVVFAVNADFSTFSFGCGEFFKLRAERTVPQKACRS